jgi:cysteine desulfurase
MKPIYLDHAATTPLDKTVLEKMLPYFVENYGNADSLHAFGRKAQNAVDGARDKLAELLNVKPSELYFTSGGTESDNWAMFGTAYAAKKTGKTHILVSEIEHHAVLSAAQRLQEEGFDVEYIPVNAGGRVEVNEVARRIRPTTGVIAVMGANNEIGSVQPVYELSELARRAGALFFTDCVQLAPHKKLDISSLNADVVAISSHKFYGPKGCGLLYIKKGVRIEKFVAGGEQERGMRGGTLNMPSIVGMAAALEKCYAELDETEQKMRCLREKFLAELFAVEGVTLNGEYREGVDLPSIVNVCFEGVDNGTFLYNMDLQGVALAAGSACASASLKPSHVLTAMGLSEDRAKSSVRFSFGKDNTEDEILFAAKTAVETAKKLRLKK